MEKTILILAEHDQGDLKPITWELAAFALKLREMTPLRVMAAVAGRKGKDAALRLSLETGFDVVVPELSDATVCGPDPYKEALRSAIRRLNPLFVCIGHTAGGMDVAPALAVEMGAACITGIQAVWRRGDRPVFARPVYNGKMVSAVASETERAVLTVLPGCFGKPVFPRPPAPGSIKRLSCPNTPTKRRCLGLSKRPCGPVHFADARVIVSAGRGIGNKENMRLIHRFAGIFSRSAVGGSRLLCDLGWLDRSGQIGITGSTVAPELYIACGVSGAFQHIAAMQGAGYVVAVNTDPAAPIFNVSDIGIVEDVSKFIPAFLKIYNAHCQKEGGVP